jgi:hypothetical protein
MRKYKEYTDKDVIKCAAKVKSMAGLIKGLDLKPAGGNYAHMKKTIQRLEIDCSHWKGQAWNKGEQLKDWSDYSRASHLKPHLIRERGHKCECCELTVWLGKPIGLEVHHIDANRTNNKPNNLQLLCGNCHQQTPNFRNRS